MPTVIDLQALGDVPGTLEVAASALLAGDLVALPEFDSYVQAGFPDWTGSGVSPDWSAFPSNACLAFRDQVAIDDLAGPLTGPAWRLTKRCWPGTTLVELTGGHRLEPVCRLPDSILDRIRCDEGIRVKVPRHPFLLQLLKYLPGPLVISAPLTAATRWNSATSAVQALGHNVQMLVDDGPTRYDQGPTVVRITGETVTVAHEGILSAKAVQRMAGEMLLFVCTGNTCRSPMAEAVCRRLLASKLGCSDDDLLDHGFSIQSAGLSANPGSPASSHSVQLLQEHGIDLGGHASQPVTRALLEQSDRVITMTRGHRDSILSGMPEFAHKVRTLSLHGRDIQDPFGGDSDDYRECLNQITAHLQLLVNEVLGGEDAPQKP